MADCIVPPKVAIVKCRRCKALYVPDREKDRRWSVDGGFASFEKCPICRCDDNNYCDTIPLWRYNLIRVFRKVTRVEE